MKRDTLLDAIGGVDDSLLMAAEPPARRSPAGKLRIAVIAAVLVALTMSAAAIAFQWLPTEQTDLGTNVANNTLGWGKFAYDEGFIYYGEMGYICRLNVNTGAVDHIPLEDAQVSPIYVFTTPEHIGYVDRWYRLLLMTKDGAQTQMIREGNCRDLYIDGTMLYTQDGVTLDRTDLTTGKTVTLAENTHGYFVDKTYIYALTGNLDGFLRSQKETVAFEELPLSFHPAMIFADGEDLFFACYDDEQFQIIHYRDGVETPLPVSCKEYQVVDGCLLYLDEETAKSYDLTTGETTVLQEDVFSFSVLEDRYICFDLFNDTKNIILDRQTGTYMELEI